MGQKNFGVDRGTETMHPSLVAEKVHQLDGPHAEAESGMGLSMDRPVRPWGGSVVSGSVASAPCHHPAGSCILRASGRSRSSQAQEQKKPVGVLGCGSHVQRAGRPGRPSHAQHSDDPSDVGSPQPVDAQTSGPVSQGTRSAWSNGQKTERHSPTRLHCGALPGLSASGRDLQPQRRRHRFGRRDRAARSPGTACLGLSPAGLETPRDSRVFADGQRHEPDRGADAPLDVGTTGPLLSGLSGDPGLYPRAAARLQCGCRALQRAVAGESLAAVPISDAWATAGSLAGLSGGLQHLPETKRDPARQRRPVQDPCALFAQAYLLSTPVAALSRSDLVDPENR